MRIVTVFFFIFCFFQTIALNAHTPDSVHQYIFFSWADTCPPYHVEISNHIPNDENVTYTWTLGDSVSTEKYPQFTISDTGVFVVYYSAWKENKQLKIDSIELKLYCDSSNVYAGSVYDYGCGHPDFGVRLSGDYDITEILVFDRWGEMQYRTTDIHDRWSFVSEDGYNLKDDTYVVVIYFSDKYWNHRIQRSQFHLIR